MTSVFVRWFAAGALLTAVPVQAQPYGATSEAAQARAGLQEVGACIARTRSAEARRVLGMDFRTSRYRVALRLLTQSNRECTVPGALRGGGLLFAGAIAEALIESDPVPLRNRLAAAATNPIEPRTPTDAYALCLNRSAPNEVAALFAADVATPAEQAAIAAMAQAQRLCAADGPQIEVNDEGLRAMLATAALRLTTPTAETGA